MFIPRKNHLFSNVLLQVSVINTCEITALALIRLWIRFRSGLMVPDMLSRRISFIQNLFTVMSLVLISLVFLRAFRKLRNVRSVISEDDYSEMAKLQEEMNPAGISSLSSYSVLQLLQIWAFVLIGVNIVQETWSAMYQNFISMLAQNLVFVTTANFFEIYNLSHGFKYIGMVTAIIIAIFVTGVFLRDTKLKWSAVITLLVFTAAFALMRMRTITVSGHNVGIVWTSVICHLMQTVGLFSVAMYLRDK